MNQKSVLTLAILLVVIGVGVFAYTNFYSNPVAPAATNTTKPNLQPGSVKPVTPAPSQANRVPSSDITHAVGVESYIKKHIARFAPVKATLGGTFYVTKVDARGGKGTVSYEDGHSSYIADFAYAVDDFGSVAINNFTVRK